MSILTASRRRLPFTLLASLAVALTPSIANAQCELQTISGSPSDGFGFTSMACDGDWLAIGTIGATSLTFYRFDGVGWSEFQSVQDPVDAKAAAIDGNLAVIAQVGKLSIYRFDGIQWAFEKQLQSSEPSWGSRVSATGDFIFVGAPSANQNAGKVFVYRHVGGDWVFFQEIADGVPDRTLGARVAADGDHVFIGGAGLHPYTGTPEPGLVQSYRWNGTTWAFEQEVDRMIGGLLGGVSIHGTVAVVGQLGDLIYGDEHGSVRIFRFDGTSWNPGNFLVPLGGEDPYFGATVAIAKDRLIVGRIDEPGAIWLFQRNAGPWIELVKIKGGTDSDDFGRNVAIQPDGVAFFGERGSVHIELFDAKWYSYGTGWPGTLGIPALAGTSTSLTIGNSRGEPTVAVALWGLASADEPTIYGGSLLVLPGGVLTLSLPAGDVTIPLDLCRYIPGGKAFLQVLELDPGASRGVSFTGGLELRY